MEHFTRYYGKHGNPSEKLNSQEAYHPSNTIPKNNSTEEMATKRKWAADLSNPNICDSMPICVVTY